MGFGAVKVTLSPAQIYILFEVPEFSVMVTEPVGTAKIDRSLPLLEPIIAGLLLTTLILYPAPEAVTAGIVAFIFPELILLTKVPIFIGVANEPDALDSLGCIGITCKNACTCKWYRN